MHRNLKNCGGDPSFFVSIHLFSRHTDAFLTDIMPCVHAVPYQVPDLGLTGDKASLGYGLPTCL